MSDLIATDADEASAAPARKDSDMMRKNRDIPHIRNADPHAHFERIDRSQRGVVVMTRHARNLIDECLAPRAMKTSHVTVANEPFCGAQDARVYRHDSRLPCRLPAPQVRRVAANMPMMSPVMMVVTKVNAVMMMVVTAAMRGGGRC